MSEAERRSIDSCLAFHSAPTLLGVKCANLISFDIHEGTIAESKQWRQEKDLWQCSFADAAGVHLYIYATRKC